MPFITVTHPETEEELQLPARWSICSHCNGEGQSSAYLGAFTAEDMHDAGPEFMEDYMAGAYDRSCEHCEGSGKVLVPVLPGADATEEHTAAYRTWLEDLRCRAEERACIRQELALLGDY